MIYDEYFFKVEDQLEVVFKKLVQSVTFQKYLEQKALLKETREVQELQNMFIQAKIEYERIEPYGKYAPDFREKKRAVRQAKRSLDLHPVVSEFRISETGLQAVLDEITIQLARTISSDIKVDTGNPFFETKSSCGGSCHHG